MLVTLLLSIIRSVGQSVAACLHVVKCVKWSSFVAYRITLLCVRVYVFFVRIMHVMYACMPNIMCVCMCVCDITSCPLVERHQLKIVYAWLVGDLSVTCA